MFQILAATKNKHKVEEYKELLAGKDVEISSLLEFPDCPDIEEDGSTFEENARKKALAASDSTEMPAFADDSGLEVAALNGEPGVKSARYAGKNASNEERIAKLLENMKGKEDRRARFVCVIAVANNGEIIETFRGEVSGKITEAPRGTNGFGYDPVFMPDGYDKTFGELSSEIKNKISHRAKAAREAIDYIETELSTIEDFDL
ncbi:MAG: non-canonical purine NTP pyrophosphatase, RdgB/HAM1 family [Lentisphaerae bacterium GWF2_44_16]|nr:MAG: non-canonical purine NTP pyrophosphatase, RdgB/HAM1 family [Lentisphaerae bacterium GWF2_44_16]